LEEKEMRKVVAIMAVLGMAAVPALAFVGEALPAGAQIQYHTINAQTGLISASGAPTGNRAPVIYADLVTSGYFANCGTQTLTTLDGFSDDIHATQGGTVTSITFAYFVSVQSGPAGLYPVDLSIWEGDPTDTTPLPPNQGNMLASFDNLMVPGADGVPHLVTLTGISVPLTGPDFYIDQGWGVNGVFRAGPLITGNSGGTVGYSHNAFFYYGYSYAFSGTWSDFVYAVEVPEPMTIGLLAASGLVVLRRRR
jgi:hypothetical protein